MNDLGPFEDTDMVRRLVDDGMVLFLGLDGGGTITWIGRSSDRVLGFPASALLGTNGLDLIHPDDHELVVDTLAESARNSESRILAVLRVRHADGHWLNLEFGGIDLRDGSGEGTFLVWGRTYESAHRLMALLGSLLTTGDLHHLAEQVVEWCDALMPYSASVILARSDDGTYRSAAAAPILANMLGEALVLDEETLGPWQRALGTSEPVEAPIDEVSPVLAATAAKANVAAAWVVAVPGGRTKHPDGLLVSWRLQPGPLLATHRRHLEEVSRLCELCFDWARSHSNLVTAATTDSLTGLANRARLAQVVKATPSQGATLLFCDLDGFKKLNDQHGHATGDQVLRSVAVRLRQAVRSQDLLVRLGGDEFVVWCPRSDDSGPEASTDEGRAVAERIMTALAEPIEVDGIAHMVRASIGVASTTPEDDHPDKLAALLRRADEALYRAKADGRGRWLRAVV